MRQLAPVVVAGERDAAGVAADAGTAHAKRREQPVGEQLLVREPARPLEYQPEHLVAEVGVQHGRAGSGDGLPQPLLGLPGAKLRIRVGQVHRRQAHVRRQPRQPGGVRGELPHGNAGVGAGRQPPADLVIKPKAAVGRQQREQRRGHRLGHRADLEPPLGGYVARIDLDHCPGVVDAGDGDDRAGRADRAIEGFSKRTGRVGAPRHVPIIARVSRLRVMPVFSPTGRTASKRNLRRGAAR